MSNQAQELGEVDSGEPPSKTIESTFPEHVQRYFQELNENGMPAYAEFTATDGVTLRIYNNDDNNLPLIYVDVAQMALERMPVGDRAMEVLRKRMAKTMSAVACEAGFREIEYAVFIGSSEGGTLWAGPIGGDGKSMLTSARYGFKNESLHIESEGVETVDELKVLLGGLAVYFTELQTEKSTSVEVTALQ